MADFKRGILSGLVSGAITGVIFSIILFIIIFSISLPFLSLLTGSMASLTGLMILGILFGTFIITMVISVVYGAALGLILSVIIPKIKLKESYIAVVASVLLFYFSSLPKALSLGLDVYLGLVSIFLISFGIVEGLLFSYFWNKFGR